MKSQLRRGVWAETALCSVAYTLYVDYDGEMLWYISRQQCQLEKIEEEDKLKLIKEREEALKQLEVTTTSVQLHPYHCTTDT